MHSFGLGRRFWTLVRHRRPQLCVSSGSLQKSQEFGFGLCKQGIPKVNLLLEDHRRAGKEAMGEGCWFMVDCLYQLLPAPVSGGGKVQLQEHS